MGVFLILTACTGQTFYDDFVRMDAYLPLDGERQAEYVNDDLEGVPWRLVVTKLEPTEAVGGNEVVTFEWTRDDTGEVLGSVRWSSDSTDSIRIHGYSDVTFDTPVQVADDDNHGMSPGDSVVTDTNGYTFTSTLVGYEACPVLWTTDDWECVHMSLTAEGGDPPPFVGDYWLVPRYGPAWMELTGYAEKWVLAHYDWEPED